MTFVTRIRFESGDRTVLDEVVEDLKRTIERKGAECKGPHSSPPETLKVPQYRTLGPGEAFEPWTYRVYARDLAIHGNERIVNQVGHMEFPSSVHVEIEVEQRNPVGSS